MRRKAVTEDLLKQVKRLTDAVLRVIHMRKDGDSREVDGARRRSVRTRVTEDSGELPD